VFVKIMRNVFSVDISLPHEITEGMTPYEAPREIPSDEATKSFKILYAVGKK